MLTHEELTQKMLDNPEVKAEYDSLEEEFSLLDKSLKARMNQNHTQSEEIILMRTKSTAVVRLEAWNEHCA